MSSHSFYQQINQQLEQTRQDGLFKKQALLQVMISVILMPFSMRVLAHLPQSWKVSLPSNSFGFWPALTWLFKWNATLAMPPLCPSRGP